MNIETPFPTSFSAPQTPSGRDGTPPRDQSQPHSPMDLRTHIFRARQDLIENEVPVADISGPEGLSNTVTVSSRLKRPASKRREAVADFPPKPCSDYEHTSEARVERKVSTLVGSPRNESIHTYIHTYLPTRRTRCPAKTKKAPNMAHLANCEASWALSLVLYNTFCYRDQVLLQWQSDSYHMRITASHISCVLVRL